MNRMKQIVVAVGAVFAVGTIVTVEASPLPANEGTVYVLAKGGTDSRRDKTERKAFEETLNIAKGGVKGPTDKRKGHAFEDQPFAA